MGSPWQRRQLALPLLALLLCALARTCASHAPRAGVGGQQRPWDVGSEAPGFRRRLLQDGAAADWRPADGAGGRLYDQEQHGRPTGPPRRTPGETAPTPAAAAAVRPRRQDLGGAPLPRPGPQTPQPPQWRNLGHPQQRPVRQQEPPAWRAAGPSASQQPSQRERSPEWPDPGHRPPLGAAAQPVGSRPSGAAQPPAPAPAPPARRVPVAAVGAMTLVMALASGLGAVPFFVFGSLSRSWAALANAVASGVMLAASFGLLAEGAPHGGVALVGGMLLGAAFIKLSQKYLEEYEVDSFEELRGADARKVILFLAVMAAHAVGEGSGVGVSFSGARGWAAGTTVALAIGLHNIPEGLAVATVLASRGASPRRLLMWTTLTALPQALVAVPSFLFVEAFSALLPLAMGFAAGCMTWIVVAELLPDALEALDHGLVATAATAAAAWLQGLAVFIAHIETAPPPDAPVGPPLAPLLLALLLPCLAPGIAAGVAASLLPARPAALGVSAGALACSGALGALALAATGAQGLLTTALLAAAGAGAAAMAWHEAGGGRVSDASSRAAEAGGPDASKKRDGDLPPAAARSPNGHGHGGTLNGGAGAAWPAASLGLAPGQHGSPRHRAAWQQHDHSPNHSQLAQQQQQQQQRSPVRLLHAGGGHPCPQDPYIGHAHHPHLYPHPHHQHNDAEQAAAWGAPGDGRESSGDAAPLAQLLVTEASSRSPCAAGGGGGDGFGLGPAARVAGVGCAAAALSCCAQGAALGAALLGLGGDEFGHLMVPVALHGLVAGVACAGALVPWIGSPVRRVGGLAATVCALGPLVSLALLVVGPAAYRDKQGGAGGPGGGTAAAAEAAAAAFRSGGELLSAAAAGWSAYAGAALLLPQARAWGERRARAGFVLGAVLAALVAALCGVLCAVTPYCLRPQTQL